MSLLRESAANFLGASNEAVLRDVNTQSVAFQAPPESAEAGQVAYSISAGQYGEIKLDGEYLTGAPSYLYLTINNAHYKVALERGRPLSKHASARKYNKHFIQSFPAFVCIAAPPAPSSSPQS